MVRIVKGIWIPIELWLNKSLSINEKVLLMEIDSFSSNDRECFISDEYIADFLGVTSKTASKIVCSLIEKGYVERLGFDGRRRFLRSRLPSMGETDSSLGGMQTPLSGGHTNKNIPIKNTDNRESNNKRSVFKKPSVEEVREYCESRNNGIDPEEFIAFYESKGWMVGKNPMKDWRSAIITWEKNKKKNSNPAPRATPQKESVFQHNMRELQKMREKYGTIDNQ